jgi:hypothetical protein
VRHMNTTLAILLAQSRDHTLGLVNGLTWIVLVYYVPIILVSLALTLWQLLARRDEPIVLTPPHSA